MGRFIIKHINTMTPQIKKNNYVVSENNLQKNKSVMTTDEKVAMAQSILDGDTQKPKRIKKDKGLIERTESSRTILTEDNKELLND
jgi:ATP-dependent protease HslVU (ClpYQ) peptidase subunit